MLSQGYRREKKSGVYYFNRRTRRISVGLWKAKERKFGESGHGQRGKKFIHQTNRSVQIPINSERNMFGLILSPAVTPPRSRGFLLPNLFDQFLDLFRMAACMLAR